MTEFFHFIFTAPNIIATFILSFCVLYWLIVIVGIIDLDMIDIDVDVDADVDVDTDMTGGTEGGVAWFNKILHFFNLGRFPFMLWLTIVGIIAWFGTVMFNHTLHIGSFLLGSVVFLVAFIAAVVIAKPLTYPLVKMFDALEKSHVLKSVIGQIGEILYPNKNGQPGEAEITHEGSHIRVFVMPSSKEIVLIKNQKVLIITPTENDKNIYLVEPYNN